MDKFERQIENLKSLSQEEINKGMEEEKKLCLCPKCPTYNQCTGEKNQLLFCAMSKSEECEVSRIQCICPTCPVTDDYGLSSLYFCANGSEAEQRQIEHEMNTNTGGK